MTELTLAEAKKILIAMTKSDMKFDGTANNGRSALVFTNGNEDFRNAYKKIAGLVAGCNVELLEVRATGKKLQYQIHNEDVVRQMVGYCFSDRALSLV